MCVRACACVCACVCVRVCGAGLSNTIGFNCITVAVAKNNCFVEARGREEDHT